jgi:general secretion pathway protein D
MNTILLRSVRALGCLLAALLVAAAALAADARQGAMITPNYKDADLGQIVEAVSQVTGKNFIVDPRVKAQVTMLSSTPMSPAAFYEAFLAILQVHGFVAVQSGAVYKIIPDANARQVPSVDLPDRVSASSDEIVTQVVSLKNVSAQQLVPILRPLIPQYGHLAAYSPGNVLIISDRANNVSRLMRIIERIDEGSDEEIEVIRLEHASASEIVKAVNALHQSAGAEAGAAQVKLIADERTNSVLLSGEKNERLRIRALVAHLDTPIERGGGTIVRYLKYADAEKLAKSLKEQIQATNQAAASGAGAGAAAGGAQAQADRQTTIWADKTNNALIITAAPKLMRSLNDVIDKLDIRRPEVLVEAIIVEVSGSKESDLGVNWLLDGSSTNVGAGGFVSAIGGTSIGDIAAAAATVSTGASALTSTALPTGATFAVGRLAKTGTDFAAILRAVNGVSNTNIVSTPSITTLDNEEATVKVVQEVPFLTGQYANATSTGTGTTGSVGVVNPFQTITRQDVGTILKITPQITDDSTILLKIEQEVSSLAQGTTGAVDLITNKRTISTRVLAADGQIIVLGGLIEDNLLEGEQNVPILSSIPLLGQLFKVRNTTKTKTNLLVFLRAKILVDNDQVATETSAKYNYVRDLEKTRGNGKAQLLPGERQPTLPDLQQLAPAAPSTVMPKSGGIRAPGAADGAPPDSAPAKDGPPPPSTLLPGSAADPTTGLVPNSMVPRGTLPAGRPAADGTSPPPLASPAAPQPQPQGGAG